MSRLPDVHYDLRRDHPSLREHGIAVRHFPAYRNHKRHARIRHDVLYGSLLLSGRVTHWIDEDASEETAGTLAIVGYDTHHAIVTGNQAVEVFNLYLDPARHVLPIPSGNLGRSLSDLLPIHAGLVHRQNRLRRITVANPQRLADWLHAIASEQDLRHPGSGEALQALTRLVLLDLARSCHDSGSESHISNIDPEMEAIRLAIDAESRDQEPIGRYARLAKLSNEQFSRRFARHVGHPPVTYRRLRRLQLAMEALRDSDSPITDVALSCGFSDLAHFNRSFKAFTGVNPRAYRHRFR